MNLSADSGWQRRVDAAMITVMERLSSDDSGDRKRGSMGDWCPPSDLLGYSRGIWRSGRVSEVSYPEDGNRACLEVEEGSYWFGHRNVCIVHLLSLFPPDGDVYDIGGGNGFVSLALQRAGYSSVLLEPGDGAGHAVTRGVGRVVQATLEDAGFRNGSMPAAGAFDVIEHIEDESGFLRQIRDTLRPGGYFYGTVPAGPSLWSHEDVSAGHWRRYTAETLGQSLAAAGFEVCFVSGIFAWLVLPIWLFRVIPGKLGRSPSGHAGVASLRRSHVLPRWVAGPVGWMLRWEAERIRKGQTMRMGSSLLFCARRPLR